MKQETPNLVCLDVGSVDAAHQAVVESDASVTEQEQEAEE